MDESWRETHSSKVDQAVLDATIEQSESSTTYESKYKYLDPDATIEAIATVLPVTYRWEIAPKINEIKEFVNKYGEVDDQYIDYCIDLNRKMFHADKADLVFVPVKRAGDLEDRLFMVKKIDLFENFDYRPEYMCSAYLTDIKEAVYKWELRLKIMETMIPNIVNKQVRRNFQDIYRSVKRQVNNTNGELNTNEELEAEIKNRRITMPPESRG